MTIVLDSSSSGHLVSYGTSSVTISHTCAGANRLLLVMIGGGDATNVTSLTYNSVNLTLLQANAGAMIYYLVNPPAGTYNIVLTAPSVYTDLRVINASFTGVDQTTPYDNSQGGGSSTQFSPRSDTIVVSAGGLAVDVITCGTQTTVFTPSGAQTAIAGGGLGMAASYLPAATAMAWTWTTGSEQVGHSIAALKASSSAGDTTAPILTSPSATAVAITTVTGNVTTDEGNGTLYCYPSVNATETVATIKASGATQAITTAGAKSIGITGLTASTTYYLHFAHRDAAGNDSTRVSSASFTTSAAGSATITSQAFKNWSGTLLTGATIPKVAYVRLSDMTVVLSLTNQVTHASTAVLAVTNAALVAGVKYLLVTSDATAANRGVEPYTAV